MRMSDISEDTWFASWLIDLEFILWEAVQGGTSEQFKEKDLRELAELSALVGGWHDYKRFIPLDEWHAIVREHGPARSTGLWPVSRELIPVDHRR